MINCSKICFLKIKRPSGVRPGVGLTELDHNLASEDKTKVKP